MVAYCSFLLNEYINKFVDKSLDSNLIIFMSFVYCFYAVATFKASTKDL